MYDILYNCFSCRYDIAVSIRERPIGSLMYGSVPLCYLQFPLDCNKFLGSAVRKLNRTGSAADLGSGAFLTPEPGSGIGSIFESLMTFLGRKFYNSNSPVQS